MIEIQLTKAEALLYMEMLKRNTREMLDQIAEEMDQLITREEMSMAAKENYLTNLENENKALRAKVDAATMAANPAPLKTKVKTLKPLAPWGYKKDGTPKKKPGSKAGF